MRETPCLVLALVLTSFLIACRGDDTSTTVADAGKDVAAPDTGPALDSGGLPPRPVRGTQIDRMGRPAINTTVNNTFNADMMSQGAAKDGYNADDNRGGWVTAYKTEAANNLAIFDALDVYPDAAGGCGNQLLCGATFGGTTNSGAYDALANLLADDRIYTRTDAKTCSAYLAVEANAAKLIKNNDCGGRALPYDVIDVTYAAFAMGVLQVGDGGVGPEGGLPEGGLGDAGQQVGDGVTADPVKTGGKMFPYLAPPM